MFSFPSTVRYSECDEHGRLTTLGLLNYLQDCATFQCESLGLGIEHSRDVGRAWLIAAWEIEIDSRPRFGDEIVTSTWAYGFKGLYGNRNFTLDTEDGRRCVRADSLWFLLDAATGRPVRPLAEDIDAYHAERETPLDMPALERRIRVEGEGEVHAPITVVRSHLDTNNHVNNAQYVEMALETMPTTFLFDRLDVQYRRAAVLGDVLVPHVHSLGDGAVVDLADQDGSSFAIVRMRLSHPEETASEKNVATER